MSYKPGDKVWCRTSSHHHVLPSDQELPGIVLGGIGPGEHGNGEAPHYRVELSGYPASTFGKTYWIATYKILRPRHDPYEGDQAGSWDNTPLWNPTKEPENV